MMSMQKNEKTESETWLKLKSKSIANKYYYYNPVTKESHWTIPNKKQCNIEENSNAKEHKIQLKKRKSSFIINEEKKPKCNEFVLSNKQMLKERKTNESNIENSNYLTSSIIPSNIVTNNDKQIKLSSVESYNTASNNYFKMHRGGSEIHKKEMQSDSIAKYVMPNSSRESLSNIKSNKLSCLNMKNDKLKSSNYKLLESSNICKGKTLAQSRLHNKKMEYKAFLEQKSKRMSKKKEQKLEVIKSHTFDFNNSSSSKKRIRLAENKNDEPCKSFEDIPSSSCDVTIVSDILNSNDEENMDWEPLEEEIMIKHINCIRKNLDAEAELSLDIAVCSKWGNEKESGLSKLILIFDTNIFISCLPFIKDIRDKFILDLGLPFFYIPWRVLQELDHLKNSKESQLKRSARKAIQYINDNFVMQHPRVYGQTLDEFSSMLNNQKISDDEILAACLYLKETDCSKRVILVTNDKNLESKALMSKMEAYSKDRLIKNFIQTSENKSNEPAPLINLKKDVVSEINYDSFYCQLKDILIKFLEQFLRYELKSVFKDQWEIIVRKKPPWSLDDMFNCLSMHWISVFKFLFPKEALELINDLKELFNLPKIENDQIYQSIAKSKKLLTYLKRPENNNKIYMKNLDEVILKMELLEQKDVKDQNETMRCEEASSSSLMPNSFELSNLPTCYNLEMSNCDYEMCKEKVKSLFKTIWSKIKDYICEISGFFENSASNNIETLNEIKWQFQHTLRQIEELLIAMDLILSLRCQEVNRINQIVRQFIDYLLNFFMLESSELNNLHIGMIILCREDEGRSVLGAIMNDLKLLGMKMVNIIGAHEQP